MVFSRFNLPNLLTFFRILCVPLVGVFFSFDSATYHPDFGRWCAFFIFIIASITDYLDGYFARMWKQTSNLGSMLDPIADKLLVATSLLFLVSSNSPTISEFSVFAALIILCREILVSGLREYLAGIRVSVPVTILSKWKTAIQMMALAILIGGPGLNKIFFYSTDIGIFLLWIAAILTLYTGYDYFRASIQHIKD